MSVSSVSSTSSAASGSSATSSSDPTQLNPNDFITLLMAQLQNQDPTQPTDPTQMVSQLAQFTSVETESTMSSQLGTLLVAQTASNQIESASLAGKTVQYNSGTVQLGATTPVTLQGNLTGAATNVTWTITNSAGQTVRTIQEATQPAGNITQPWDGTDGNGNPLPRGTYTVSLTATGANGTAVTASTMSTGVVSSVSFSAGYPQLVVGGQDITLTNVVQVYGSGQN
jgi:flagellar basal-body rod modification protein FlgD